MSGEGLVQRTIEWKLGGTRRAPVRAQELENEGSLPREFKRGCCLPRFLPSQQPFTAWLLPLSKMRFPALGPLATPTPTPLQRPTSPPLAPPFLSHPASHHRRVMQVM